MQIFLQIFILLKIKDIKLYFGNFWHDKCLQLQTNTKKAPFAAPQLKI